MRGYNQQEVEDQLPFAFFQINAIFKVFLPIALLLASMNSSVQEKLAEVNEKNMFAFLHDGGDSTLQSSLSFAA